MTFSPRFTLLTLVTVRLFIFSEYTAAQNLVPNGSFEIHGGLDYGIYDLNDMARTIKDWKSCSPREPMYCHNEVVKKYGYAALFKRGYYKYDTTSVPEGRAMVKFDYVENCPEKDTGCTAYLQCKLVQPLMVGEVYEVSMWVRIEDNPSADTAVYSRIGMYLTKHRTASWPESSMLHAQYYFGGQLTPGQWQQIKWNIRALCALEYLTIGMFRDSSFHSLWRQVFNTVHYYVDDVRIVRLDEDSSFADIQETPYCEYYEREHTERVLESVTELTIRYASATFDLSDLYAQALDSFYMANRKRKSKVFVVCGYTDDMPGENEQLALRRANSLKDYLCLRDSVNPETFLIYGFGSRNSIADNRSESGRRLNRRATIRTSDLTFDQLLYRKCLESLEADSMRNAFRYAIRWLRLTRHSNKVQMLVDPRLAKLKSTPYWGIFVSETRRNYRGYPDPEGAFFLDSMYFEDQRFRTYSPYALSGYIPEVDTVVLEAFKRREDIGIKHDSLNARLILAFMERKGFPRISVVGRRPCRGFYNILLHTADRTAFEVYLPVIENLCLEGECEWNVYALMADKVAVLNGEEQQYGTQYVYDDQGRLKMYRISSIEEVNARRRRIGLPPVTLLE